MCEAFEGLIEEGRKEGRKEELKDKAFEVKEVLSNFRVKVDDSDKSPGWKFSESEMRGIPVRVEIGPRDIAENQAVLVRRDTHEKITVSLDEIAAKVGELLETIHHDMFERAKAHRDSHTYVATTLDEMKEIAENKPGFIKAMWCGNQECEDKLKEVVGVTSRCIPFNQEHLADTCVCCGKPATKCLDGIGKITIDGVEYLLHEDNDAAAQIVSLHLRPHIQYLGSMIAGYRMAC